MEIECQRKKVLYWSMYRRLIVRIQFAANYFPVMSLNY